MTDSFKTPVQVSKSIASNFAASENLALPYSELRASLIRDVVLLINSDDDLSQKIGRFDESAAQEKLPDEILFKLVGILARLIDPTAYEPQSLREAARMFTQISRMLESTQILYNARAGEYSHQTNDTGEGHYMLYLRSFTATEKLPHFDLREWGNVSLEEILAAKLFSIHYPMVALGNPEITTFGSGKIQTTDDTWQEDLAALGEHSDFIFLIPCITNGTCWEMEWVTVKTFLRKTVFVMPPATGQFDGWWRENWAELNQWSTYQGLSFPEYDPRGQFFILNPHGGHIGADLNQILKSDHLHLALLNQLFSTYLQSEDWIISLRESMEAMGAFEKGEKRESSAESHVERLEVRLMGKAPDLAGRISFNLLGMLEKGLPPGGKFRDWPNIHPAIGPRPGVMTIWQSPSQLLWVEATVNIKQTLSNYVEGDSTSSDFRHALQEKKLLDSPVTAQLERTKDEVDEEAIGFFIRRNLSYRVLPAALDEAHNLAHAIRLGVLDCGPPELGGDLE